MITLDNVTVEYPDVTPLDGVSLTLEPGATAIMGPSGSGKSTLLRSTCCSPRSCAVSADRALTSARCSAASRCPRRCGIGCRRRCRVDNNSGWPSPAL